MESCKSIAVCVRYDDKKFTKCDATCNFMRVETDTLITCYLYGRAILRKDIIYCYDRLPECLCDFGR